MSSPAQRRAAANELGAAFRATISALRRMQGRETHHSDRISNSQYGPMFELERRGELPAGELAQAAGLSAASATQMLNRLAAAGLVLRRRAKADRRVVRVRLSAAGRRAVAAREAEMGPRWLAAFEGLEPSQLRDAALVLERIAALFEEMR